MYDFSRCKLCGESASPKYKLKQMVLYACAQCDFHFIDALDALPAEQPDTILLTEKARNYIEKQLPQNAVQLKKNLAFVKSQFDLSGKHCLDIGSGAGQFSSFLQEEGGKPQGIEPQQIFREFAQKRYQLDLKRELVEDYYRQDGYVGHFDLVTLWDTLEHVNFPAETLQAAFNLLKPGGFLFLDTPSRESIFYRASEWSYRISSGAKPALLNRLYSPKAYRHKQIFTKKQLWRLLEDCGFSDITLSTVHRSKNKMVVVCRKNIV